MSLRKGNGLLSERKFSKRKVYFYFSNMYILPCTRPQCGAQFCLKLIACIYVRGALTDDTRLNFFEILDGRKTFCCAQQSRALLVVVVRSCDMYV